MASRAGLELVQKMMAQRISSGCIDQLLLNKVKVTSVGEGTLTAVMTVEKEHANIGGTLHGAMSTYLVDAMSTLTLATCPGVKNVGVSLNINMT
ncbi:Acyl-coenzyme A thioesterase 13 [Orchesella cincta]|uniref:Acyl-coenzyme A thioesterase 13 n=1 Tax=Orchesella cincta TaxID=48709 RepID=A0A1D2MXB6_ORCCI|nr:Acyl-coenzyme A thioesterase 13 [Orchesella cincta]